MTAQHVNDGATPHHWLHVDFSGSFDIIPEPVNFPGGYDLMTGTLINCSSGSNAQVEMRTNRTNYINMLFNLVTL